MNEIELNLKDILRSYPLRVSITDYCNLHCFFCSNEGMERDRRNQEHLDVNKFDFLLGVLAANGLKQVSLTGGEPTLHPGLEDIVRILKKHEIKETFFHTNGIRLTDRLMDEGIKEFTKIAISLHASNYETWTRLTGGSLFQYYSLQRNLEKIRNGCFENIVEIKHVPIRGYNDGEKDVKYILDLCDRHGFKFKFLSFEAIEEEHLPLVVPYDQFRVKLERLGCIELTKKMFFRGQTDYLPATWYSYGSTKGVAIEIGCGKTDVCRACYASNEIFLTPSFEIKPCHISDHRIPLNEAIERRDTETILKSIIESREFLRGMPGQNSLHWRKDRHE